VDIPKHNRCRAALQPRAFLIKILPVLPAVNKFEVLRRVCPGGVGGGRAPGSWVWDTPSTRVLQSLQAQVGPFASAAVGTLPRDSCPLGPACKSAVAWNLNSVPHFTSLSERVPSQALE
jgi:hypothetical protein